MNKDSHLIFEAYKNKLVSEDMPYPTFAKLSKHASPKSSKESLQDWETRMKKLGYDITKDIKSGTYHAWHDKEHTSSYRTHGENEEKPADKFKDQMPDSKEEYSAHDYAKEMEIKGEGEESLEHISKYKHIIDQLARGTFDTDSEQEQVDQGSSEGIFEVEIVNGNRQVVLTNAAVKKIEQMYPELKGKFWECGKCKADYKGCGDAKHDHEDEEGELMKHMKDKGMIDAKATDDTGKYGRTREEEEGTEYVVGKTYTITLHNGEKFTGVFKYQKNMDRYDRSTGAYGSSWEQVLVNDTHVVVVGHGRPHHVPEEDEQRRLDPKCWKGYHKAGTKLKSGVRVNNCVKN